jgi:hypothetical protein
MARPLQDEADPMREYDDDNIRLYAPVLQRVVILAAVVIAVPVMMWTITTFIRSYVARPKAPTFQHLALTEATSPSPASPLAASPPPPQAAPPAPQSSAPPATQPTSAPPLGNTETTVGGIGRPPLADTGSAAPPITGASPSPPPAPTMAGAAVVNPAQGAAPIPQATMGPPDAPALPTVAQPAGMAARLATNGSGMPADAPADHGADRNMTLPAPSAGGPSAGNREPPVAMTETAATEALPPPQPIKGRIPLPRRRPAALALAATVDMAPPAAVTDASVNETTSTDALPPPQPIKGRIPLPRRRPAVLALAATTGSIVPSTPIGRAVPMPKTRPFETPPDQRPAPASAPYGYQPGLDGR